MHFQNAMDSIDAARDIALGARMPTDDKDSILSLLDVAEMYLEDMRQAIVARYSGEWDAPPLAALGPLMPDAQSDVLRILGR